MLYKAAFKISLVLIPFSITFGIRLKFLGRYSTCLLRLRSPITLAGQMCEYLDGHKVAVNKKFSICETEQHLTFFNSGTGRCRLE